MLHLTGYSTLSKLHESHKSLVYKGFREADQKRLIFKILKQEYPSPLELIHYRQEYELTRRLDSELVIRSYGLKNYQNTLIILLEDFGGMALNQSIRQGSLSLESKLKIAIKISEGLGYIHNAKIIHKDINPANLVINLETEELKIIDFGISTDLAQENPLLKSPNLLEGTLYYLSPEQTGRMNCALDYRTDFYSFGATLYELFTHQPPFLSQDELELIHCHLAKTPPPPHQINSNIPPTLSGIILKLLAKQADERYQSAYGIQVDLETCLKQLQNNQVLVFNLAQEDYSKRFRLPQKLYGREQEIKQLLTVFDRVCCPRKNPSEMVLISGYSGIGKSALVKEIYKPVTQAKGYFISGKFEQYQRHIPYSAIIQAFQELVAQLLTERETKLERWRNQIQRALGKNGQVIVDVIPEVELIIGSQPSISSLPVTEAQNRLNLVFENFIQIFTQPEHPLVIFLDDLQWADPASLQLIQKLVRVENRGNLLLIGAYRDNEIHATHPWNVTLENIKQSQVNLTTLSLTPLSLKTVCHFIKDTFKCSLAKAECLSRLIMQKTEGNPFFINEFLKSLVHKNLLYFNNNQRSWQWDIQQIEQQEIAANVLDLMTQKIEILDDRTQGMLKQAACIGNQFNFQTLTLVCEQSPKAIAQSLKTALNEGFILSLNNLYQSVESIDWENLSLDEQTKIRYKFAHDRIQQVTYSLIPNSEKQTIHYKIGQLFLRNIFPQDYEQRIFEIVKHLNVAIAEINTSTERQQLAQLNIIAGKKAKKSVAYESAYQYFHLSRILLTVQGWKQNYNLMLESSIESAEMAYLSGEFTTMEQLINEVLEQAKTLLEKVKVYEIKIQAYKSQNQVKKAINIALSVLDKLGISLSSNPSLLQILVDYYKIKMTLKWQQNKIDNFIDLPTLEDQTLQAAIRILAELLPVTYYSSPKLMAMVIFKMVDISINHGISLYTPITFASYGGLLCGKFNDIKTGYKFGQLALNLLDKLEITRLRTRTTHIASFATVHWKEPLRNCLTLLEYSYQEGVENGDLEYAALGLFNYSFCSYFCGRDLTTLQQELSEYIEAIAKINQTFAQQRVAVYQQVITNLIEATNEPDVLKGDYFDEYLVLNDVQFNQNFNAIFHFYLNKIILNYLFGHYEQGYQNCNHLIAYKEKNIASVTVPIFYFYDALTILARLPDLRKKEKKSALKRLNANRNFLQKVSHFSPSNHLHKFYLVEAEYHSYCHNINQAISFYEKAIKSAEEYQYCNELALINERIACFYLQQGKDKIAQAYLIEARYLYSKWGAVTKVTYLEEVYSNLLSLQKKYIFSYSTKSSLSTTSETSSTEALDLQTVIKASQILSEEIMLDPLLEKLMKVVLENAGAQKGFLMLEKDSELSVEAVGEIDPLSITVRQSLPLRTYPTLSSAIVNYVKRTRNSFILDDPDQEIAIQLESDLHQGEVKSILCTPIVKQGKFIGLLYLENNLTENAFTKERLKVLELLLTQIAISLENATYYERMSNLNYSLREEIKVRRKTEQQLRESEERFRIIADTSPVPLAITRFSDGEIRYANPACNLAVNSPPNGLLGRKSADFYVNPQERLKFLQQVREEGKADNCEVLVKKIDGTQFWINASSRPIIFDGEQMLLTAFFDLTERKRNEEFQENYRQHLEMEVKEQTKELSQTLEVLKATQTELVLENSLLREAEPITTYNYQVGGSLPIDAPTYVVRSADRQLYKALKLGEYCYILNPRQMGKSSLQVQMMKRLTSEGFLCASVDLSAIGNRQVTLEQWYAGFTYTLVSQLKGMNLREFRGWWKENNFLSPVKRLGEWIEAILIPQISEKMVIFIDEIDSVLDLEIELDDFFILLRYFWNKRADNPDYKKLNFVFLGVATPSQLLSDNTRTPFNIGTFIQLKGFQVHEAQPLIQGLSEKVSNPQAFLKEILHWTNGQPFLTQKICKLLRNASDAIPLNQEAEWVQNLVETRIINHWESQDEPEHLKTIRDRLLSSYPKLPHLFTLYHQIYRESKTMSHDSQEERELILSGLIIKENGYLYVQNPIYYQIFDEAWIAVVTKA
ncbi:MAG: AAA family ATPase [Microcystaceae cyanobacterium]